MLVLPLAPLVPGKDGSGATVCSWEEKMPWLCRIAFWPTYRPHEWVRQKAACSGLYGPQGRMSACRSSAASLYLAPSTSISGGSRSSSLLSLGWSSQHGPLSWVNASQAGWSKSQEEKIGKVFQASSSPVESCMCPQPSSVLLGLVPHSQLWILVTQVTSLLLHALEEVPKEDSSTGEVGAELDI